MNPPGPRLRGTCVVCGRTVALTNDARTHPHRRDPDVPGRCPGSGAEASTRRRDPRASDWRDR